MAKLEAQASCLRPGGEAICHSLEGRATATAQKAAECSKSDLPEQATAPFGSGTASKYALRFNRKAGLQARP